MAVYHLGSAEHTFGTLGIGNCSRKSKCRFFKNGIRWRPVTSFTRRKEALACAKLQAGELQRFSVGSGVAWTPHHQLALCCKLLREWVGILFYFPNLTYNYEYTECPRRNGPNFGRVFLMLNYTDITQNTFVQSWTVTEIMAREVWKYDSCYTLTDYQIHIETDRNIWFL
jgi:hypothetical protein